MQSLNRLKSTRPRKERDFYETPYELCEATLNRLMKDEVLIKGSDGLDAGAGNGVWGRAYNKIIRDRNSTSLGIDLSMIHGANPYDWFIQSDFLGNLPGAFYANDLVYGNPPYSLAEEFVRQGLECVGSGGYVYFLLRLAFLESKKRHFGLFTDFNLKRVYVLSRRPSFFSSNGRGKTTDALSYAMFLWQKDWGGRTQLDWLYWNYDD